MLYQSSIGLFALQYIIGRICGNTTQLWLHLSVIFTHHLVRYDCEMPKWLRDIFRIQVRYSLVWIKKNIESWTTWNGQFWDFEVSNFIQQFPNQSSYIPEPSPISKSDKYESEEVYRMLYEVQMLRYHLLRNGFSIEHWLK